MLHMTRRKRIGLLIPHLESGGAERVLTLISCILKDEYDVYFFVYSTKNISYNQCGTLIDLKCAAGNKIIQKIYIGMKRVIKLSYYIRKYKLDTMLSFLYSANRINYLSFGRLKKWLAIRGYQDYYMNHKSYYRMLKGVEGIVVQTQRMKSEFMNTYHLNPNKIKVLMNPFNIAEIVHKGNEPIEEDVQKFIDGHKVVVSVGAFKRDKGYWHLIKAFSLVKKQVPAARLIIIGHRGEMEKEIYNMAQALPCMEDILFLGYQANPFRYITKCDLYVCTSLAEGFPNAIVEAMACKKTVLSTDCLTGPREILLKNHQEEAIRDITYGDYGVLVPVLSSAVSYELKIISKEEQLLALAISELLENDSLRLKYEDKSYERVKDFHYDQCLTQLRTFI